MHQHKMHKQLCLCIFGYMCCTVLLLHKHRVLPPHHKQSQSLLHRSSKHHIAPDAAAVAAAEAAAGSCSRSSSIPAFLCSCRSSSSSAAQKQHSSIPVQKQQQQCYAEAASLLYFPSLGRPAERPCTAPWYVFPAYQARTSCFQGVGRAESAGQARQSRVAGVLCQKLCQEKKKNTQRQRVLACVRGGGVSVRARSGAFSQVQVHRGIRG